jgi:Tol biopolymer transport system component
LHFVLTCLSAPAATQVGSAPYRASATGAGNSHSPVFSADGKHIAFVSQANNLVTNDDLGPHLGLFVRDLAASNTVLVSVSTNGFGGANDNIGLYTLASNAQVVAFDTAANNLAPGDTNRVSDIYVRDLLAGATRLVSVNADGTGSANGPSYNPLISQDGRYVIFESLASNLVTNDFNGTNDIFIHDLMTGVTELVSLNAEGTASPDGPSHSPSISADGLTVALVSQATNLVDGVTNKLGEIYARDITARTTRWAAASHIAATRQGFIDNGAYQASVPILSADGRYVVFKTLGQVARFDLTRPTNSVYVPFPDQPTPGYQTNQFQFDDNPRLAGSSSRAQLSITPDGRFLAMNTSSNLVPNSGIAMVDFETLTTNQVGDHANWSTNVLAKLSIILTNVAPFSAPTWRQMTWLSLSSNAARISFIADATNLFTSATNRSSQLYSLDTTSGTVSLLSANASGLPGTDLGDVQPSITADGSLIAWDSPNDNIVADDLNRTWDVFVRSADTGETQLASERHPNLPAASGTASSRLDLNPGAISGNGRRVAILSLDNTLAPDDTNNWRDLFVRNLVTGTNIDVSRSTTLANPLNPFGPTNPPGVGIAAFPSLSTDGNFVAFAGDSLSQVQYTNRTIYWRDLLTSSNRVVASGSSLIQPPTDPSYPFLSSDGRFVAFHTAQPIDPTTDGNGTPDIYIYVASFAPAYHITRNPFAVSLTDSRSTGNGPSINPVLSPDGTWVVFQSTAADLTSDPDTAPGRYQLFARQFLTDRTNVAGGPVRLISYTTARFPGQHGTSVQTPLASGAANPRFSADSRYVAFEGNVNLIYRHDLFGGWVTNLMLHPNPIFPSYTNLARLTNDLVCSNCVSPSLSSDGRFVAYETLPGSGAARNVSVKDLQTGQEELISMNFTGSGGGNGPSFSSLISHDARFVVFASTASNLVPGDHNRATDIFVRDRLNRTTHSLSCNLAGTGTGNRVSSNPIMSADGRTVAFQSFASDIVPGDYNDTRDVFVVTLAGPDTDGDGMDDDWEMANFNTLERDGSGDFDHDGATDLAEFRAGTNPANDASILRVLSINPVHDSPYALREATLVWSAVPGRTYRLQFKDDAARGAWMDVPGHVVASTTSASKTHTPTYYTGYFTNRRFYRVLLVQ